MKVGKAEGTPEEISNFYAINDLNITDYLETSEDPLHAKWILIPSIILFTIVLVLVLSNNLGFNLIILLFLSGFAFAIWAVISLQLKFKNAIATTVAAIGSSLILLIAAGFLSPIEILEAVKSLNRVGR